MRKILLGILTAGAVGGVTMLATNAFFSDTETSTGNLLQAGAIDLKVDNTCYYNGQACIGGFWGGTPAPTGTPSNECSCTWQSKDLDEGDIFFNFSDLKPGDWEEDTISLKVNDNNAWACLDLDVTENSDNGFSEPEDELSGSATDLNDGTPNGDLAQELNFIFWVDDGDNVLETNEVPNIITQGPASTVLGDVRWALADSSGNLFEEGGALIGGKTYYVGKAFCFGQLTTSPVTPGENSPLVNPGVTCNGSQVSNLSQTDKLLGNVKFEVVQSRNNPDFRCNPINPNTL